MYFINKGRMIDTDSMAKRLEGVLLERDISTHQAGRMIGKSGMMISKLINGKTGFTIDTACDICKALDIDFVWFITGLKIPPTSVK